MRNPPAVIPHRFPSLSQLQKATAGETHPGSSEDAGAAVEPDGYPDGFERGYREGYESGIERAREEGRNEGASEARMEAVARFDALAAPVEAMLRALRQMQTDYQVALRRELVDLVGQVARQVIRRELSLQPAQLLTLVEETVAELPASSGPIEVHLNQEELRRIQALDSPTARRWSLVGDPRLRPGECRVKVGKHEADAGCEQRLAACLDQLTGQLLHTEAAAVPVEP